VTMDSQSLNVQEELLREKIDPWLTDENLSALATAALGVRVRCDGYSVLTGGLWNRVIAVSTEGGEKHLVFKLTPKIEDTALRREYQVLQHFRAHTAMRVPAPYLLDVSGNRLPGSLLIMEKIPGTVLSEAYEHLSIKERACISEQIAEHLVDLHTHRQAGFGGVEVEPEQRAATWLDFWLPRYDATLAEAQAKGTVPDNLLAELHDIRRHFPPLLDIGSVGTLTHYDIWTGNVMVQLGGDQPYVTGYLDLMGYYADYTRELSSMFRLADERLMQLYEERHGLDKGFKARFSLYTLKMCLQLVNMYPTDPRHMENARRHLQAVQGYFTSHRS